MGSGTIKQDYWVDSIAHWSHRLTTERNVDKKALADWCSLYAATPFRKSLALEILHKVVKKDSGGYAVRNPSAFIVTGVKEAWHKEPVSIVAPRPSEPECRIAGGGSGSSGGASWGGGSWGSAWWGGGGWGSGGWGGWGW